MAVGNNQVSIQYGNATFQGSGTPYVSREQDVIYYGQKWCQVSRLTLNGTLTGNDTTALNNSRTQLENAFSSDFKTLTIKEGTTGIAVFPSCVVRNIDVDSYNHTAANYSIQLDSFDNQNFITGNLVSGTFGVLDPENSFSYNEQDNGLVQLTHSVSARGVKTGVQSSLTEAINFVDSLTGVDSIPVSPRFIGGVQASNLVLDSLSRNIDRASSTYSVEEVYSVQTGDMYGVPQVNGFVTEIGTSINSGIGEDYSTINVNYTIRGDKYASEASIRAAAPSSGVLYNIATGIYGTANVFKRPINLSIDDQAKTAKRLSVSCDFIDNSFEDIQTAYFDFSSSVNKDEITDVTEISVNGEFKAIGPVVKKYETVSGLFYDEIVPSTTGISGYLFDIANSIYSEIGGQFTLNNLPSQIEASEDKFKGIISLSCSFNDSDFIDGEEFFETSYNVSVTPSRNTYAARPSCNKNGLYGIYDLNSTTRELTDVSLSFKPTGSTSSITGKVQSFIDDVRTNFVQGSDIKIQSEDIDKKDTPYFDISFTAQYNSNNSSNKIV